MRIVVEDSLDVGGVERKAFRFGSLRRKYRRNTEEKPGEEIQLEGTDRYISIS